MRPVLVWAVLVWAIGCGQPGVASESDGGSSDVSTSIDASSEDAGGQTVECKQPHSPYGGDVEISGTAIDDKATYSCEPDHDLVGDSERSCGDDGRWSGAPASCRPFRPPHVRTLFNYPPPGEVDDTIEDEVIDLLDAAADGSQVRASFFSFSRVRVAEAFADAQDRGVDVEVILGNTNIHPDGNDYAGVAVLRDRLGEDLTICNEGAEERTAGCIGTRINHNKFITFSELDDGARHVVMQTSANMNNPQRREANNLVAIHGDQGLFDAYNSHWEDQKAQQEDEDYYHYVDGDFDVRAYFFPRQDGDTIVEILDDVSCAPGATLHVAMAFFSDARTEIAERLVSLDGQGCKVRVLLREKEEFTSPGEEILSILSSGDIDLAYFPEGPFEDGTARILHSKYMLIDAPVGEHSQWQQLVLTGSHNYNISSLERNDEVLLRIRDDKTHGHFVTDWERLRPHAQTLHP